MELHIGVDGQPLLAEFVLAYLRHVMDRIHEGGSIWDHHNRRAAYEKLALLASNLRHGMGEGS